MGDRFVLTDIAQVTPEWLSGILAGYNPGLIVDAVSIVDVQHGACTKVRLSVRTNRNDFPTSLMMKAGFEPHSTAMASMHVNEYHAYADLLPTVSLNAPRCYGAAMDDQGQALVILEDLCLRDVRFLTLQEPISFDLAKAFLSGLAEFHARWWNAPDLDTRFGWAPDTSEACVAHYFQLLTSPEAFQRFATAPRGAAMPKLLLDPARIRAAHLAMTAAHKAEGMAMVINHGDMHLVDRRRWEAALLQHYLACLELHGIAAPRFDAAWAAYRRDVIWGLLIWMLNSSRFQTEANNTAAATRFAMAMIDHDTFGMLGV